MLTKRVHYLIEKAENPGKPVLFGFTVRCIPFYCIHDLCFSGTGL